MNCIKCDGTLRRIEVGGAGERGVLTHDEVVEVDQCDACGGIWFDSGELRRVLGKKSVAALRTMAKVSEEDDAKRGRCPRCKGDGKLVQVASVTTDIHIDTCSVCGGQW